LASEEFGVCLECGEPIPAKRLMALPWAALCLQCQEIADRNPRGEETDRAREDGSIMEAA
jgi:DnaK suppressor protein